jgi:hypothetical protein
MFALGYAWATPRSGVTEGYKITSSKAWMSGKLVQGQDGLSDDNSLLTT